MTALLHALVSLLLAAALVGGLALAAVIGWHEHRQGMRRVRGRL